MKGKHQTPESNEKNRQAHLGKFHSIATRKKISDSHLGKPSPMKGKHPSLEARRKMSESHKGEKNPLFGKHHSKSSRKKTSEALKRRWQAPNYIKQKSDFMRKSWQDPDFVKKVFSGLKKKTRPECQLDILLQQIVPDEFKYNGGFECGVSIDGLIPDFINVNGKKQVIDVHGDYWHKDEDTSIRAERYAKCGFFSLVVWEKELKNEKEIVVQRIIDFVGKEQNKTQGDKI